MARRKLTTEEEQRLVEAAEAVRDGGRRLDASRSRRVRVADESTAVLSVRLPVGQLRTLRARAAAERIPLSDMLRLAIESYVATPGPVAASDRSPKIISFYGAHPAMSETMNVQSRTVVDVPPTSTERSTA